MPIYHCTLSFSYAQDYSWVEQFWRQDTDSDSALFQTLRLAGARFSILGAGATCYRVRVCEQGLPRGCISSGVQGKALPQRAMLPIEGLDVRLQNYGSPSHWRNFTLRGLPEEGLHKIGGLWRWSSLLGTQGPRWLRRLVEDGWCLQVEEPLGRALPILGWSQMALVENDIYGEPIDPAHPPPGKTFVQVVVSDTLPPGGTAVKIHGAKVHPNRVQLRSAVNGTHKTTWVMDNSIGWLGSFSGATDIVGGTAQVAQSKLVPIATANLVRRVACKCGPFKEAGELPAPQRAYVMNLGSPRIPLASEYLPAPPPVPIVNTYRTLQDVFVEIWKGYNPVITPSDPLIGIAQVHGQKEPTYAVFLAGVDWTVSNRSGWKQMIDALKSAVGLADEFTIFVRNIITNTTPDGCKLWMFGHSFGGMVAQWCDTLIPFLGSRLVTKLVGVGTVWIVTDLLGPLRKRLFYVTFDPVPALGPLGNATVPRAVLDYLGLIEVDIALAFLQQVGISGQTHLDSDDVPINPITRHNCYPTLPDTLNFNWDGSYINQGVIPPMETGIVLRYEYPLPLSP